MCDLRNNYTPNEVLDHPKLSDDYKIKYFFNLTLQEDFYGLLNSLGLGLNNLGLTIGDVDNLDYIWDVNAEDNKYINSQTSAFENEDEIKALGAGFVIDSPIEVVSKFNENYLKNE